MKVPLKFAKPFIVGVYYGNGKPDLDEYFQDTFDELLRISPGNSVRRDGCVCYAELRLVLGDCPMRAWMTGASKF